MHIPNGTEGQWHQGMEKKQTNSNAVEFACSLKTSMGSALHEESFIRLCQNATWSQTYTALPHPQE